MGTVLHRRQLPESISSPSPSISRRPISSASPISPYEFDRPDDRRSRRSARRRESSTNSNASGLRIFGPSKAAAQLEASKAFAKSMMREAGISDRRLRGIRRRRGRRALCTWPQGPDGGEGRRAGAGKGVTVCEDAATALRAVAEAMEARRFGAAGARVVIEDRLVGEELSFFALCRRNRCDFARLRARP